MLLFRWVQTIFICGVVAGCGFQPLYGTKLDNRIISDFSEIQVSPGKDRIGQLFTNELKYLLNPLRELHRPKYRLTSVIDETTTSLAVKKTALATRANLIATVDYDLYVTETGLRLTSGSNKITVGYNIFSAGYANIAAEKDARSRAVKELAQDLRLQLGAFFKNNPQSP
ncbi:MAG: hypothetical protein HQ483_17550 [Rhodospirillales bacterium]|nr:hypothetical protein [Rhodospirillales bacterium]